MTQDKAFSILKTGANVFLTGEPGSGKTHSINRYVEYLREHDIEPAITASTGIAATHIGGMTIHSWSGIGIQKVLSEEDLDKMGTNERLTKRVSRSKVLIIDEISMLDALTLSAVDASCRTLRRNQDPFGGLQVVFVGDFFQLPPVTRAGDRPSQFAFMSSAWEEARPIVCYLSEQHRQDDEEFISFLSSVRSGDIDEGAHLALSARKIEPKGAEAHTHTRLYSHNVDVDKVNSQKLGVLSTDLREFVMESIGPERFILGLKKGCLSPEKLHLKIGARVMFTKNSFDQGFVNGTLGEIESFSDSGSPIVRTKRGSRIVVEKAEWSITDGSRTLAKIIQIPLRLAWAITVHKSQGMTLDSAVIDLSGAFEYGQGYVALSRVRAFSGLFLLGYNQRALEVHPDILLADGGFKEASFGAEEAFGKLSLAEQEKMESNFIVACGGKIEKGRPKKKKEIKKKIAGQSTYDETLILWKEGKSVAEIASVRSVTERTIVSHLEELFMRKAIDKNELAKIISDSATKNLALILKILNDLGVDKLSPVFEKLDKKYSYEDLRLIRLLYT
ncbi:MAG: helix-turn-helix domain-containing protein [Patescibacteria group bacterium]